jgi:hypothetical protein
MEVITELEVTDANNKMIKEITRENLAAINLAKMSLNNLNTTIHNDSRIKMIPTEKITLPRTLETTETTFSKLEFDKFNLFFKTVPNVISFDRVKIKNTGTTCIYYKWQKNVKTYSLTEKKSDGIDRFFCHYVIIN